MELSESRVRRMLRAERLRLGPGQLDALRRCRTASDLRALTLSLRRSLSPGPELTEAPSWLERMDAWQRGHPDVWLDEALRLGLPVREWLGEHESLLQLVGRTLQRCLEHDLRGEAAARSRLRALGVAPAVALCEAADPGALRDAQARLLEHDNPAALLHFSRVWPAGASLDGLRRSYLALLAGLAPQLARERSVVGCVDLLVHDGPDGRRSIYDWDAVSATQGTEAAPGKGTFLPLRCGLRVPLEVDPSDGSGSFSAFEWMARGRPEPGSTTPMEDEDAATEAPDPETLDWDVPAVLFPAVDRLLVLLARAVLGRTCPKYGGWLPAPPGRAEAPPPLPPGETGPFFRQLVEVVAPHAVYGGTANTNVASLLQCCGAVEVADPASDVAAAMGVVRRLRPADPLDQWVSAWAAAVFALCLWRWRSGLLRISELLPRHAGMSPTRDFRQVALLWLKCPPPSARPKGRQRRPDGVEDSSAASSNAFDLDPLRSDADHDLLHVCASASVHRVELLAWGLNEWPLCSRNVELLAARADPQRRAHGSSVWIHHRLLDAEQRSLDAFKRTVSKEGLVPWSLSELDEALLASRPVWVSPGRWRSAAADRVQQLPDRPWTAARCWSGATRTLAWLVRWARGAAEPEGARP